MNKNSKNLEGPLPALFYFTLSKEASLSIDPYNQLVQSLPQKGLRVFSYDLPYHTIPSSFPQAIAKWAEHFARGEDILTPFFKEVSTDIDDLIHQGIVDSKHVAVAGLSRGAFVACHVAALNRHVKTILGFAPLTQLSKIKEFAGLNCTSLDLSHIAPKLVGKKLRFYIGNRDTRVGTDRCFSFIEELALAHEQHGLRSFEVELIIQASHGHMGHGTLRDTFESGALWLQKKLEIE